MNKVGLSIVLAAAFLPYVALGEGPSVFLTLQDTSDADLGIGPGVKYTVDLPEIFFADARVSYMHYQDIDMDLVPFEITGGIRAQVAELWHAYFGIGAGYYWFEADRGEVDDEIGYQVYGGGEFEYGDGFSLFAELRFRALDADADATFAAVEGLSRELDLDGIGLNVGLSYRY